LIKSRSKLATTSFHGGSDSFPDEIERNKKLQNSNKRNIYDREASSNQRKIKKVPSTRPPVMIAAARDFQNS
jgi:hypothetical protein